MSSSPSTTPGISPHRSRLSFAVVLAGVLLLAVATASAGSPPDFRLKDLDGNWFRLSDHTGDEVIYITFWATWCIPCRRELPHLQKMYDELVDKGFLVVAVNTDPASNRSKIKPFVKRHKFTFPFVLDPDNNVHDTYNPTRELPYAVLIDAQGNLHRTYAGYRTGDEVMLREEVLRLLGGGEAQAGTTEPGVSDPGAEGDA